MTKKNTKKALAMAAAAAAVTGGTMAVTGNVHADTVNTQADSQNQTQKPQASDLKTQQDASRQAYADANKANADAQSNLAQASAKNTTAQGNVDSAQTDVDTATQKVQSATTAEQNTQSEVTQAQTEANKAQNDYNNAVKQQAQTDQAVQQAQSDLKTANQAVSEAQKVADQANAKQAQAQTNANTANQNVENTNAQVQKTQGDVNDAQASVKNAENDVQTAQNHDQVVAQDQSDVQAKTDAKNKADAKVNDAQKVNDEKIEAQSNAQTAVNNAQKTVDQLSKDTSAEPVENALATTQEWINTLKEAQNYLLTHNNTLSPELDQKLSELGSKLKYQKQYQSDPTLKNQKVEYNNDGLLSNQDEIQITKFALSLINPIREQLGMPALTITQNALKIANNVANTYNRDNWIAYTYNVDSQGNGTPIMKGHDENAFENAINPSNPANTGANTEAMTASEEQDVYDKNGKRTGVTHYIAPTMDELYARIYGGAADMLFTDSNMQWGHTYTLLGMGRKNENQTNNIGVQTDRYGQIHYVLESSSQNDHSNLINVNNNDASQAYKDLLNAEDNYKKFINDHQNDDLNFSDMVSEQDYKDDKASYDADPNGAWAPTYKATVDQYNKQQAALKPYLDAIDQAQTKLDQVYFAKTSDSSKTDDHAAQLDNAKKALQDAQAKLETTKQAANQTSADLASAKADAKTAADELKTAQDKLAHDSGSSMSLADAQEALKNAKAVLAQKQVNLADAKKAAQKAQTMKIQSDSALASAKQEAQAAQKALADTQAKAKSAQEHVDALTSNDQAVANAKDNLNAANQKLQVAKSNHETAQDNLTKAQNELKQAQTKLENAKDDATKAANALKNAQMKADKTKNALAKAKDNLITDSKVYGNSVAIKDQTIHTGEINKIVDPEIANPMAKDPTQSLVMGAFLQMAASKLDTIPTGTTAKWNQPQNVSRDANLVGDHSEDVLVTFPDGSTTTVKMGLHVLAAAKPSQPETPVVNPGHETKPGDDQKPTTPNDPKDQPGHDVKPGDGNKPSTEPSTTPSHEEQQPGTHTDTPTAKPSDQQPSTQPSGDQGQTKADQKSTSNSNRDATVVPNADHEADGAQTDTAMTSQTNQVNGTETVVTKGDKNVTVKPVASEVENTNTAKRSDLNNGKLPQTGDAKSAIALGIATLMTGIGLMGASRKRRHN